MPPTVLVVEFLADGRCVLGNVARAPEPADRHIARRLEPAGTPDRGTPIGSAFHCPLPYAALGTNAVELRVVLPSGAAPVEPTFPRLQWRQSGHDWVGTATLPAAPAFVGLGRAPAPVGAASFGWNFYGFFLFAAAFILAYFAWARWMRGRTSSR